MLLGLLQFFLQTLVLGSDFADALLAVLQQTEPGADMHHLLAHTHIERTVKDGFSRSLFNIHTIASTRSSLTGSVTALEYLRTPRSFTGAVGG